MKTFLSPITISVPGSVAPFVVTSSMVVAGLNADMLDGLHAADITGGAAVWGGITGDLEDQADLDAVLDALLAAIALKAAIASPTFTGTPEAPTASGGTNTTQIATTAFVQSAIAALINSAPGALDTLDELAAALGDDSNFASTVTTALAGKQPLDTDLTAIAALVSAANKMPYATGAGTWALADLTAAGRALLDDADAAAQRTTLGLGTAATEAATSFAAASHSHAQADITNLVSDLALKAPLASPTFTGTPAAPTAVGGTNTTQLATTAFVQAAIASLINSAPGALDTLDELANALGDDANFASTVTTALAGKQPIDADLTAIAALTSAADKMPYATGSSAWALTDLTAFARTMLDDADAATLRTTIGLGNVENTALSTGNALTATTLQTARNINGVAFNGSANITVTAAAGTLTGATLNATVTASSLTSLGTLTALATAAGSNTNLGGSTAGTLGTLTINPNSAAVPALLITGTSTDTTADTAGGFVIYMTHNASGNRQVCFGASENFANNGAAVFRFLCGASIANLDGVSGTGGTRLPMNLGTDTSDVAVGNNALAYNASIGAKLRVYQEASKVGVMVSAGASGSADLLQWANNSGTALSVVSIAGNFGVRQTAPTAYLHLGAGTATANTAPLKLTSGTLLTAAETGAIEYDGTHLYFTPASARVMVCLEGNICPQPTTLVRSQTVASGYVAVMYDTVTIPTGVTLTVNGKMYFTNPTMNQQTSAQ